MPGDPPPGRTDDRVRHPTTVADDPDDARGRSCSSSSCSTGSAAIPRTCSPGKISQPRADRQHPPAARRRPAVLGASSGSSCKQVFTVDFGASLEHQRGGVAHPRSRALGPSLTILVPLLIIETILAVGFALMVAYVRGSLTDRTVMIICTVGDVDLVPRLHHRVPVVFAYMLGWFPVQGWGDSFWENLVHLRVAADPDRAGRRPRAAACASTARSSSTRSTRTTCAPRAPRACPRTA